MYRSAYEQPKAGIRSGVYSTLGLVVLLLEVFVLYGAGPWWTTCRSGADHPALAVVTGTLLWTSIPYLLLNRQVHWSRLAFGGLVAAIATTAYSFVSTIYMPEQVER